MNRFVREAFRFTNESRIARCIVLLLDVVLPLTRIIYPETIDRQIGKTRADDGFAFGWPSLLFYTSVFLLVRAARKSLYKLISRYVSIRGLPPYDVPLSRSLSNVDRRG